ncbi:amino acid transporter [Amylibacter kogurei]|uniref:Amino acid transporter n=1 Tax=Paramylibacter kogurei TaxID=1889778 RepID=A0A2G5K5S0_9RHOB|nr:LysE/ArgO family amino acid transporter [Amylibacter kogurei]PIB24755.1 amino acid transporter [Amylibacter kogurei]
MITAGLTGFSTSISLILAIGAQNTLVLRQGLARAHVLPVVLFCAISDAVLIALGVAGFSAIVDQYPSLPKIMAWGGAIFLFVYGAMRLYAAATSDYANEMAGRSLPLRQVLFTLAGVTWLNPHVYLDTLALIGAISTKFPAMDEKLSFAFGAVSASFVFFFALGFGAKYLAPFMRSPRTWRVLDVGIAIVMFAIAILLIAK